MFVYYDPPWVVNPWTKEKVQEKLRPLHVIMVAPARDDPTSNVAEWQDTDGNPLTLRVLFKEGMADVPDPLGRYLIDKGLAKKHPTTAPMLLRA